MTQLKYGRNISSEGYKVVQQLPRIAERQTSYWIETPNGKHEFTHSLFKFPAKFHPPIVRWALNTFYQNGVVLDPFMGSGTVQVEAVSRGIPSIGIDVDPLAIFISQVKSMPLDTKALQKDFALLRDALSSFAAYFAEQEQTPGGDITFETFEKKRQGLEIPPIPNITHWFRLYVIIDLANVLRAIEETNVSNKNRDFFKACFASIIRRVSNAEPGTVSGLEVTKIQAKKNKNRKISVYKAFYSKVELEIQNMDDLWQAYKKTKRKASVKIFQGDVLEILEKRKKAFKNVSLVITSPPYCRAVEYSRRHYLEMYWLGFVDNPNEHIALAHTYIGRRLVRQSDWDENVVFDIPELNKTIADIQEANNRKGRTVRHYFFSMNNFFETLSNTVSERTNVICIVGNSVCCKIPIDTANFVSQLASQFFELKNEFSYAIQNHHMQYGLWNGDGIKQEYVLVLKKR